MRGGGAPGAAEIIRPGLDRIRAAFALTGHPERAFGTIHIAGTNGKGSTACFLAGILGRLLKKPVGLYTSPHLMGPEERIRLGGHKIPAPDLGKALRAAADVSKTVEAMLGEPLSYFEEMTWVACDWFRKKKAGLVVMEAGLGGRWDATNACEPDLSIITGIGIDHREWLGGTVRAIAFEKAGILKPGVPAVLGVLRPAARKVILGRARASEVSVWEMGNDFRWQEGSRGRFDIVLPGLSLRNVKIGMEGRFQRDNAAIACAAAWRWALARGVEGTCFGRAAREGLGEARWPGRLTPLPGKRNKGAWTDGAHNPDAARALSLELERLRGKGRAERIVAVWSMLRDKDIAGFLRRLKGAVDGWVAYPMDHERAASLPLLAMRCRRLRLPCREAKDFREAWTMARRWAGEGGLLIVCGSFVAVGDAYRVRVGRVP